MNKFEETNPKLLTIPLGEEAFKRLADIAVEERTNLTAIAVMAVLQYLEKHTEI